MEALFDKTTFPFIAVSVGIKEVIYLSDKYQDQLSTRASKKLLDLAGVKYTKYQGRYTNIELK